MRDFLGVLFIVILFLSGFYWWMGSSCAQRGVMEGYTATEVVGTKCYGSNDGKDWHKIWY